MAEYIVHQRFRGYAEATSAGVRPGLISDTANAVFTLKQFGIDASGHKPCDVREINLSEFDLIVTMDSYVARALKQLFPALPDDRLIKCHINDPYGDDLAEYKRCANVIQQELKKLLSNEGPRK